MVLKTGDKVFTIWQKKDVKEVEFLKFSKRGTSAFFKDGDKEVLVTLGKIYETKEEAEKELVKIKNIRLQREYKEQKERVQYEKDREEIYKIITKIETEFNIEKIPFLSQPHTIEEANEMYRKMQKSFNFK